LGSKCFGKKKVRERETLESQKLTFVWVFFYLLYFLFFLLLLFVCERPFVFVRDICQLQKKNISSVILAR
jgi:hypothetical protein